jgi:hypothetical protein
MSDVKKRIAGKTISKALILAMVELYVFQDFGGEDFGGL